MKKPTMLYASPFPPMPSGISDYSVMLVKALCEAFDITLYTDHYAMYAPELPSLPVLRHGRDVVDFDRFDYRVYNMGNSAEFHSYIYEAALEHPGMVILHDFSLYHFFRGYYNDKGKMYSKLYQWGGNDCLRMISEAIKKKNMPEKDEIHSVLFPLNGELLSSDNLFMVHSEYARNCILKTGLKTGQEVRHINMIAQNGEDEAVERQRLFRKFEIPEDAVVVAAFGSILDKKLNRETIAAVKAIAEKTDKKICYVMVGGGTYVDDLLVPGRIIKTGYTELNEFNSMIEYADIILNLRNPSHGETSASMLRIMQKGKPCITNNGGWFSEIPEECACKIELDDIEGNIEKAIRDLVEDDDRRRAMGEAAKRYVDEECSPETIRDQIRKFLESGSGAEQVLSL